MQIESAISGETSAGARAMPLFHAAWQFALGIALAHWLLLRPGLTLAALAGIAILCVLSALRAQRILWLPLAALWCMLGAWCAQMEPYPAPAPGLASLSDGLLRTMEGTVVTAGPVRGEIEQNLNEDGPAERDAVAPPLPFVCGPLSGVRRPGLVVHAR